MKNTPGSPQQEVEVVSADGVETGWIAPSLTELRYESTAVGGGVSIYDGFAFDDPYST